jgi:hypothetical protein
MSRNNLLALIATLSLGVSILIAVVMQVRLAVPFSADSGPVEWLDCGLLALLAGSCAAIAAFWRDARRTALWTISIGFAVIALLSAIDLLRHVLPAIDPDDLPMLASWILAAAVLLHRSTMIRGGIRVIALLGFALHNLALGFDLVDTMVLPGPSAMADQLAAGREIVELLYLAAYCLAGLLLSARVVMRAFAHPAAARRAGIGVPGWIERRLGTAFRLPTVRKLRIAAEALRFRTWQRRNPGRDFADYYAAQIGSTLKRGQPHRTLGTKAYGIDAMIGGKGEWTAEAAARRGVGKFQQIRDWNLQPQDRVIDYGCGSLRVGQHLIRFLEPGRYTGIDIADTFYKAGIELLERHEPGLLADKAPRFGIIGEALIEELAQDPPAVLLSVAVVIHVAPQELEKYFDRVLRLVGPNTRAMIHVDVASRELRTAPKSWAYPEARFRAIVAARRPELNFDIALAESKGCLDGVEWRHGVIRLTNSAH